MADYKLSSKAEFDLTVMYEFGISKFGLLQAQKYFFEMHDTFELLSTNRDLGRDSSQYINELKRFTFKSHTLFYMISTDTVFIVRVLSQKMDYEFNLLEQ
jgi:toxin ParE1/3/4|tara:strand:- start:15 stop:314 length:300 start_codon:yes stop_codon:yes gene_type:complete